jgi:uncharacterized protein YbjT (DUF2867 family)
MKIIITGSLGNISKPLTSALVQKGHSVTVISSKSDKQPDIEALGATAAIGSLEDIPFLAATFNAADAVYCMTPPNYAETDMLAYYKRIGTSYVQAIQQSGVKRVIYLSSYGAHLNKGTGIILGSHYTEAMLNELPDTDITHMRPGYFYYNLNSFSGMIHGAGVIAANYGADDKLVLVSPVDIAAAIAEEIVRPGISKIRYVASDEKSGNEIAAVLGAAIGKPDLKWVLITDEEMLHGLVANGVPAELAAKLVEMGSSIHSGAMTADYYLHKPVMGKVKLSEFALTFKYSYATL